MAERYALLATASRGTEELLAEELTELGAKKVRRARGHVRFLANLDEVLRICVHSRLAMRVLYPLAELTADGADGLYDAAASVAWEEHLTRTSTFAIEATLKDSEHTHSGFVALKIKDALVDRLRQKLGARPDVDTHDPDLRIVAHLAKNQLSLSLDLCGESLNRRGYRVESTTAPLKETLAAAVLRAARFTGEEPFADPMCGSGTLAIEAAHIAMRRAPGLKRQLGVERWPHLGQKARDILKTVRDEAKAQVRPLPHPVFARDRDPDALAAAKSNAKAAGVMLNLEEADVLTADAPAVPEGLLVSNPPYGDRLTAGGQKGMKSFYFHLGERLGAWGGWKMALLCGNPAFESAFHHKPQGAVEMWNGPIECRLYFYERRPNRAPA